MLVLNQINSFHIVIFILTSSSHLPIELHLTSFFHAIQTNAYAFLTFSMRTTYRVDLVNHVLITLANVLVKDTNCDFLLCTASLYYFHIFGSESYLQDREKKETARQKEVFYITTLSVAKIIQYIVSDRLVWSSDGMLSTRKTEVLWENCSSAIVSTTTNPGRRPTAWSMAHGPRVKVRQNFSYYFLGWSLKYSYAFRTHLCKCITFLRTAQRYWHNLRVFIGFPIEEWIRPSEISFSLVKEGGWIYHNWKSFHYCVLYHGQLWVVLAHTTRDSCRYRLTNEAAVMSLVAGVSFEEEYSRCVYCLVWPDRANNSWFPSSYFR